MLARSLIMLRGSTVLVDDLPDLPTAPPTGELAGTAGLRALSRQRVPLDELERRYITQLLGDMDWNYTRAAEVLHVHRNTLRRKTEEYGIQKPQ